MKTPSLNKTCKSLNARLLTIAIAAVSLAAADARADEIGLILAEASDLNSVGVELGSNGEGTINGGVVLRHFKTADGSQFGGQVGSKSTELRLGRGVGIANRANSGVNLVTAISRKASDLPVIPVIGLQPLARDIEWNSNTDSVRQDYIEWMPSVSAGAGLNLNELCGVTARVAYGAAIGTTGRDNGTGESHGLFLETECDEFLAVTGSRQIVDRGRDRTKLARMDVALPLGEDLSVGFYLARVRTEEGDKSGFLAYGEPSKVLKEESRAGIVVGGAF